MTRSKDFFSNLEDKDLQLHVEFGDDGRYNIKGVGTITMKRESGSHIHLKDVMYVPVLKKKIVSIVVLEHHEYDVMFSKGEYFLKHVSTRQVKQNCVRV